MTLGATFPGHMHSIARHIWGIEGPLRSPLMNKMSPISYFLTTDALYQFNEQAISEVHGPILIVTTLSTDRGIRLYVMIMI